MGVATRLGSSSWKQSLRREKTLKVIAKELLLSLKGLTQAHSNTTGFYFPPLASAGQMGDGGTACTPSLAFRYLPWV